MDKIPKRTDMVSNLLGKRERLTHEPTTALAKGIVKTLDMRRFSSLFAARPMALGG